MELKEVKLQEREKEGRGFIEMEEQDPFFTWPSGSPYSSRKPKIIINVDHENLPTLKTLQILLRDTYIELKGGEPGAYPVEFIANEPRFPEIQNNVVTLDLTGDEWNASLKENGRPEIKLNENDIVPKLKELASNTFTGELGFLIVNLPPRWEKSVTKPNFAEKLTYHLSAPSSEEHSLNVLRTVIRIENEENFRKKILDYFGFKRNVRLKNLNEVHEIDEYSEKVLKHEDWPRVALTKRQGNDSESDEHYFLKASIVEGFAYWCYRIYKESDPNISYNQFLKNFLFDGEGVIATEEGESQLISDIIFNSSNHWADRALKSFFSPELQGFAGKVYVEVETGRSEGAFNFRKIREKIGNYSDLKKLWIVLPPRLLFRGKKKAYMLYNLATQVPGSDSPNLVVPMFNLKRCVGLQKVDENYIKQIYEGSEDGGAKQ